MPLAIKIIILSVWLLSSPLCAETWQELQIDLSRAQVGDVVFFKTNLKKFKLTIDKLDQYSPNQIPSKTALRVNASFFDTEYRPLGLILTNGEIQNKVHWGGSVLTGVLIVKNGIPGIKHRDSLKNFKLEELDLALQAGPRLIAGGQALTLKNDLQAERRSGVCLDGQRHLILYSTAVGQVLNFKELQEILLIPEIGCQEALNLDGGSSAQYYFYQNGKLVDSLPGFSTVPNYLTLNEQ